jgi:hypothetical protein
MLHSTIGTNKEDHDDSKGRKNKNKNNRTVDEKLMDVDEVEVYDESKATAVTTEADSPWAVFQFKYPDMKDHVDLIKKKHQEVSIAFKMNGKKMTPEMLSFHLASEFYKELGDYRMGNKVFGNLQIAIDALKILKGDGMEEDMETIQA